MHARTQSLMEITLISQFPCYTTYLDCCWDFEIFTGSACKEKRHQWL